MQEVFMYSNFKTNYPFHIIHGIITFGYILLFLFPTKKREQNINKQKTYTLYWAEKKKKVSHEFLPLRYDTFLCILENTGIFFNLYN